MDNNELLQAMQQLLLEERQHTQDLFIAERQYTKELFIAERQYTQELLEKEIAPLRQSIVKLESLPGQIKLIAEGHTILVEKINNIEVRLDKIEDQLDNAVIVKAAR